MNRVSIKKLFFHFFSFLSLFLFCISICYGMKIDGLIHLHSQFSTGRNSLEEIVDKAKEKGIKAVLMTDHDVIKVEYGIPPFRNIFKKDYELQSVTKRGASEYIEEIEDINKRRKNVVVIPGVESTAHYFWSGSIFNGNLTANNWQKHILLVGFHSAEEIDDLPVIHNGFSLRYVKELTPKALFFLFAFILSFLLYFTGEKFAKAFGLICSIISLLLIINYHPFQSTLFNQYESNAGVIPYQELIDYANEKEILSIWAHPESYKEREINGVRMLTPKYVEDLLKTYNYTAFEGLYRDTATMIEAGKEWDILLLDFIRKERNKPIWTVGGIDYHGDEDEKIDEVKTIFITDNLSKKSIIQALKNGRCYAVRQSNSGEIVIDEFLLSDKEQVNEAEMGESLKVSGEAILSVMISEKYGKKEEAFLTIVRNGKIFIKKEIMLPFEKKFLFSAGSNDKGYFRLMVNFKDGGKAVSNPIFYNVSLDSK
ncbi:MAG: PHP domain-containing protein [Candidatus Schekmanbacteria bacterium]|nr:MAG: PHP domain-containing protein [Candidatus Schekmanbacteria bacterium]